VTTDYLDKGFNLGNNKQLLQKWYYF